MKASIHIFKAYWDHSYSGNQYISEGERFSVCDASFCPECVREDLTTRGFSYWRRYAAPHVTVCFKHNAVLQNQCPYCDRTFNRVGHDLDIMWRTCRGRHLGDAPAVPNEDATAFRRAKIYHHLCNSTLHISDELAAGVAREKAASLIPRLYGDAATKMQSFFDELGLVHSVLVSARISRKAPLMASVNARISDALVGVYESCHDYEKELNSLADGGRPVHSLTSTYRSGGTESAHFVEENYEHGVGHWSCPHPSWHSNEHHSADGFYRRQPKIYQCCNFLQRKGRLYQLKPVTVIALPKIPTMFNRGAFVGARRSQEKR